MKKILVALALFIFSELVYISSYACDASKYKQQCVSQLGSEYTYLKSFQLNGEAEYSFVFSKGTLYMLTTANALGEATDIEIQLFDPSHKLIVSNYDKKNDKYYPINYPCNSTGVHYMKFIFNGKSKDCGLSVLGFKRGG